MQLLTGDEALEVLRELLAMHPDLVADALRAANALLATASFPGVAQRVFDAVVELGLDDFDAGPSATGYVAPSEAAWEAIETAVAPYFNDLKRRMALRHLDEAEIAKGIVLGLYRAERRGFELLDAEDCPSQLAGRAVDIACDDGAGPSFHVASSTSSCPSGIGSIANVCLRGTHPHRVWCARESAQTASGDHHPPANANHEPDKKRA